MRLFKKFSFWLTIFSVFICVYNYLGYDDMNIGIYLVSPPFWLLNRWLSTNYPYPSVEALVIIYTTTILFWLLLGIMIDKLIKKTKNI